MEHVLYLSKSAFAAHRGVSPGYVTKLRDQGRLVMAPDGKRVDVAATEALLESTADPSKAAVADRHQQARIEKGVYTHLNPAAAPPASLSVGADFQKAKAHHQFFLAKLTEDEFLKRRGELVERKAVDLAAFNTARTLRDLILGLPPKVAGELIAITDTWEMERRLTELLRSVLEDAASLVQLDAELEQGAKEPN